jgi:dynein intermediate chain 2
VQPEIILRSMSQLRSVSFNPRDQHILAGGSIYGAVGIWDVRKSQGPVECVPIGVGHSESATSLIWSNSKAGVLRILLSLWRRPSKNTITNHFDYFILII